MASNPLSQHAANLRQSLFDQKLLDQQFVQLEELEELDSPGFVEEVIGLYFRDADRLITTVEQELQKTPLNVPMLEKVLHQFKGSSASVGASKVTIKINLLRGCLHDGDMEKCMIGFHLMKCEQETLQNRLETYFQLKRQAQPDEIADRREWSDHADSEE